MVVCECAYIRCACELKPSGPLAKAMSAAWRCVLPDVFLPGLAMEGQLIVRTRHRSGKSNAHCLVAAARLIWRGTRPHSTTRVNASRCCPRAKDSSSPAPKATNQRQWWQASLGRGTRLGEARSQRLRVPACPLRLSTLLPLPITYMPPLRLLACLPS